MKIKVLRFSLLFLGLSAVGIGLSIIGFGPDKTVRFFASVVELFGATNTPISDFNSVNVDNEFRFYAVFWVAYGGFLIQTSQNILKYSQRIPFLLGLFFLGGLGRLLSYFAYGLPHTLFTVLLVIELVLPTILYLLWRIVKE